MRLDGLERHTVYSRCAVILLGQRIRLTQSLHLADMDVQTPETPGRFNVRLDIYVPSQVLQTYRRVYHPSLPPMLSEPSQAVGPLCSTGITRLPRYCGPIRHPLAFGPLPGVTVIGPTLLRRFRAGARRASPVAWHVLVIVPSLPPRRTEYACQSDSPIHAAFALAVAGSAFGSSHFRGHIYVHIHYGPMTRTSPKETVVDWLQKFSFPPLCYPSYGASDFYHGRSIPR